METHAVAIRPVWDIDRRLARLVGREVRAAAEAFVPVRADGAHLCRLVPTRDLILPDNSQPGSLPVFFEGRLSKFERRIGVVLAWLEAPPGPPAAEGLTCFRGTLAVILQGPALIRLAFPFRVEPLPIDPINYWEDLHYPSAQFRLPFASPIEPVL